MYEYESWLCRMNLNCIAHEVQPTKVLLWRRDCLCGIAMVFIQILVGECGHEGLQRQNGTVCGIASHRLVDSLGP